MTRKPRSLAPIWIGVFCSLAATAASSERIDSSIRLVAERVGSTVDPHWTNLGPENAVAAHVYDTLFRVDFGDLPQPGLALGWEREANQWRFQLRTDVHFSNGRSLSSVDVLFSLCRATKIAQPLSFRNSLAGIKNARAEDTHQLVINTHGSEPFLLNDLSAIRILPAPTGYARASYPTCNQFPTEALTERDEARAIGSGPYIVSDFEPGNYIAFENNPHYWGKHQPWSKAEIRVIPEAGERARALLEGIADCSDDFPISALTHLEASDEFKIYEKSQGTAILLAFNHKAGSVTSKRVVREALQHAIDRDRLVQRVLRGHGEVLHQIPRPKILGHDKAIDNQTYAPTKSQRLLSEAGITSPLALRLIAPEGRYARTSKLLALIRAQLKEVGITLEVATIPYAEYFGRLNTEPFDLALMGWGNVTGDATYDFLNLLASKNADPSLGQSNAGNYQNPKLDALIETARHTYDVMQREALLLQANRIAIADTALLPLYVERSLIACNARLTFKGQDGTMALLDRIRPAISMDANTNE